MLSKSHNFLFFIQLLFVWLLTSCIDRISLETEGTVDLLVIEGSINNGPGPYTVTIRRSGDFSEDQLAIADPVTGAQAQIIAETGEFSSMVEVSPGVYETDDLNFLGTPGNTYHVEVTLANGKTYHSIPEKLLPVPPIEAITFEIFKGEVLNNKNVILERNFIRFKAGARIPEDPENRYLKWNFFGEYEFVEIPDPSSPLDVVQKCYLPEVLDLNRVVIFDGKDNGGETFTQEVFVKELDYKFHTTYCFHLYQQSLTFEAFEFWELVENLVNRSGSLFEVPPGRVRGNIINPNEPNEEVLGYFYATSIDSMRLFVRNREIEDIVIPNFCDNADPELMESCFNCALLFNSSLEKPPYWED